MSDDIPLIFALELHPVPRRTAVFLSAASTPQMQQYATAGWNVMVPGDFTGAAIDLAAVPARPMTDADTGHVTLLSCEAPHLTGATAPRIAQWRPALVKINCAFHGVSEADGVVASLEKAGYQVLGALWRDDNSFSIRSVVQIAPLAHFAPANWDRLNIIGVRDQNLAAAILTLGRLYTGEEARIAELRVANSVRSDIIARLEDAMVVQQPSDVFKLQRS